MASGGYKMVYIYAKNIKELKKILSKKGVVGENIGRTHPRFNLDGKRKYYVRLRLKRRK
jgi:hypothetical protein